MSALSGQRVIVVDDEVVIASTLEKILKSAGFDTASFTEPVTALEAAIANPPDMLISDVVLPSYSGIELARRVQHSCPKCKIILFSGHAEIWELFDEEQVEKHRFEVLSKPMHPTELLKRIRSLMGGGEAQAVRC